MIGVLAALALQSEGVIDWRFLGDVRCATWPTEMEAGHYTKAHRVNFVLGVVGGVAQERKVNLLEGVDAISVGAWLDRWCDAHPLETTIEASQALIVELAARQRDRNAPEAPSRNDP